MRLCTSHLKIQPMDSWSRDHGFIPGLKSIGLRADEPERAAPFLAGRDDRPSKPEAILPMYHAGITGEDVGAWWARQPYQLGCSVAEGNCTLCHLKSEARLARATLATGDTEWWEAMAARFGTFRRDRTSYAQIRDEAVARMDIAAGVETDAVRALPPRRRVLIERQERRYAAGDDPYSCSCAVVTMGDPEEP